MRIRGGIVGGSIVSGCGEATGRRVGWARRGIACAPSRATGRRCGGNCRLDDGGSSERGGEAHAVRPAASVVEDERGRAGSRDGRAPIDDEGIAPCERLQQAHSDRAVQNKSTEKGAVKGGYDKREGKGKMIRSALATPCRCPSVGSSASWDCNPTASDETECMRTAQPDTVLQDQWDGATRERGRESLRM
ncbi:hypothetical protein BDY21DRAFT_331960 [Lineolata rhizophorae]|uniref:Uncharacterized protein n=1 Tax=Lineolata rhizophorae TaxID=578093 RepID=A0A6A6PCB1_9PEZI|nr:hypothetical protein BDY21DRAFT_331960 [Lineolata rhizophorae]